jgi:hypothetical protein
MTVEEYLHERNHMQEELFRKVEPMTGAVALVRGLVSGSRGPRSTDHGSSTFHARKTESEPSLVV